MVRDKAEGISMIGRPSFKDYVLELPTQTLASKYFLFASLRSSFANAIIDSDAKLMYCVGLTNGQQQPGPGTDGWSGAMSV